MGKFVNGLLGESSVAAMAGAMQTAPRTDYREVINNPIGASEMLEQQQEQPPQQQEQPPQQQQAEEGVVRHDVPPPSTPTLSDAPEGAPMQQDNTSTGALPPPSPEEEKQARVLMANVVDFLYGEGLQQTTKTLKTSGLPVPEAVAKVSADLVTTQMDAAEIANQTVSPNIIMSVGAEVVTQVYELAEALGVWQPANAEEADADMNLSFNYAANLFINTQKQTGRQDRIAGIQGMAQGVKEGAYDSEPGSDFTNEMAPVQGGMLQ